jgi:CrcB protein
MYSYLSIALGGAIGAVTRFWLSGLAEKYNSSDFPIGTLSVNIIGSFLIGVLFIVFADKIQIADQWRPVLMIGFLGAMTTFSTFSLDALLLFQQGNYNTALFYLLGSVLLCLLSTFAGMQFTRLLF